MNVILVNTNEKHSIRIHSLEHGNVILPPGLETNLHFKIPKNILFKVQTVYPNNKLSGVTQFGVHFKEGETVYYTLRTRDSVNNVKNLPIVFISIVSFSILFLILGIIFLKNNKKEKEKGWLVVSLICLVLAVFILLLWILLSVYKKIFKNSKKWQAFGRKYN